MTKTSTEKLVGCPRCGRENFTERGLKAHVCKGPATALAVVENKPVDLEKLDGVQIRNSCEFDPNELGRRARMMFDYVESLRTERSKKAILVGVYLHQVKVALGHGPFRAWAEEHLLQNGNSFHFATQRTITNYMSLAAKFCRSAKLLMPEIVAANQLSLDLKSSDSTGEAFMAKLDKFVGDRGLTELMQKHEVIKRGGYRPVVDAPPGGADRPAPPSPEQIAENNRVAAYGLFTRALGDLQHAIDNKDAKRFLKPRDWIDLHRIARDQAAKLQKLAEKAELAAQKEEA